MSRKKSEEYVEIKGLLKGTKDYHVYHMKKTDYAAAYAVGFLAAAVVLYVFFNSMIVSVVGGIVCAKFMPKYYQDFKQKRQLRELRTQFKDLLESLTASYSAGLNTVDAFAGAAKDMLSIYGEGADIVQEVNLICEGLRNNLNIEALLLDFANRSGLEDIMSFANVFEVCNRQGSDLKRIVSDTREIINDKIEIEMEIETMLSGNKNELNVMMVMPLIMMIMLKSLGTVNENTPGNVLIKIICIVIFILAYILGRKLIDIKI